MSWWFSSSFLSIPTRFQRAYECIERWKNFSRHHEFQSPYGRARLSNDVCQFMFKMNRSFPFAQPVSASLVGMAHSCTLLFCATPRTKWRAGMREALTEGQGVCDNVANIVEGAS